MAWKMDDKGNLVKDDNGNPIWTLDDGTDRAVDYAAMSKGLGSSHVQF